MKIQELLSKPEAWCKRKFAANRDGLGVAVNSPRAEAWCLIGAMIRCYPGDDYFRVHRQASEKVGNLAQWNDKPGRTHADVLTLARELNI